jgi:hypothetical protein
MNKKLFLRIGGALVLVFIITVTAGVVIIYNKQAQITQWAIAEANAGFIGTLEVKSSRISLFHDFPYVDIDLQGVAFYGDKEKSAKPLYEIGDLYLGFRWWDVIRSNFDVKLIDLEGGHADIVQFANGDINILLAKNIKSEEGGSTDTSQFKIHLQKVIIKDFDLSLYSEADSTEWKTTVENLTTKVKLESDQLLLALQAATRVSYRKNNAATFITDKQLTVNTDLDYHLTAQDLVLRDTHIGLDEAKYGVRGHVLLRDSLWMDLKVAGEKPDFSLLTAFAPADVAANLKKYKNAGNVFFEGTLYGTASDSVQPKMDFRFGCEKGFFQNSISNKKIEDLEFLGTFTNGPARSLASSIFELKNFSVKPERGIFQGNLRIQNFLDPQIAVNLHSDLDLEFLGEFLGVEGVQRLKGNVIVEMNFNEIVDFNNPESSLARLKEGIESELIVRNLSFLVPGYPHPIKNLDLHAEMKSGRLVMDTFDIQIADSDLKLNGSISNLPALFHQQNKDIVFKLEGQANRINLATLLKTDTAHAPPMEEEISDFRMKLAFETSVNKLRESPIPWGEFYIEDLYARVKGYPHTFHDLHADVIISDSTFQLKDFSGEIDQSDFHFNGRLTNYNIWFDSVKNGDTRFEFDLYSEQLRLDNLLSYKGENYLPEDYRHEVARELKLHGLVDLNFKNSFRFADLLMEKVEARLNVHPLKIEKMRGRIHYEDEHISIQNLAANMGVNDFVVNLNYYTGSDSTLRKRDNLFSIQSNQLNLDQLLAYNPAPAKPKEHAAAFNIFEIPFTEMAFRADIRSLKHHQIDISNFKLRARTTTNHYLFIDTLDMSLADGRFAMTGYLNGSNPEKIYFKSKTDFRNLNVDKLFIKFDNFGQDFLVNKNLHGSLSGTVNSLFRVHPDLTPILNEGEAHLDIAITQGSLVNFAPLQAMSGFFKDKNLNNVRFDTLRNKLDLVNGTLNIPAMTINSSLGFIEMEGKQSLDLKMDYLIRVPLQLVTQVGFQALFGGKRKEEVDPEQEDAIQYRDQNKRVRFLNVRVSGTPDDYTFALGKKRK